MLPTYYALQEQPSFPREDLTDKNAALLEAALRDEEHIEVHHMLADEIYFYRQAHAALARIVKTDDYTLPFSIGFDYGVKTYEAIATMLQQPKAYNNHVITLQMATVCSWIGDSPRAINEMINARDEVSETLPRLTQVLTTAKPFNDYPQNERLHEGFVLGAMLECQTEIDTLNEIGG